MSRREEKLSFQQAFEELIYKAERFSEDKAMSPKSRLNWKIVADNLRHLRRLVGEAGTR